MSVLGSLFGGLTTQRVEQSDSSPNLQGHSYDNLPPNIADSSEEDSSPQLSERIETTDSDIVVISKVENKGVKTDDSVHSDEIYDSNATAQELQQKTRECEVLDEKYLKYKSDKERELKELQRKHEREQNLLQQNLEKKEREFEEEQERQRREQKLFRENLEREQEKEKQKLASILSQREEDIRKLEEEKRASEMSQQTEKERNEELEEELQEKENEIQHLQELKKEAEVSKQNEEEKDRHLQEIQLQLEQKKKEIDDLEEYRRTAEASERNEKEKNEQLQEMQSKLIDNEKESTRRLEEERKQKEAAEEEVRKLKAQLLEEQEKKNKKVSEEKQKKMQEEAEEEAGKNKAARKEKKEKTPEDKRERPKKPKDSPAKVNSETVERPATAGERKDKSKKQKRQPESGTADGAVNGDVRMEENGESTPGGDLIERVTNMKTLLQETSENVHALEKRLDGSEIDKLRETITKTKDEQDKMGRSYATMELAQQAVNTKNVDLQSTVDTIHKSIEEMKEGTQKLTEELNAVQDQVTRGNVENEMWKKKMQEELATLHGLVTTMDQKINTKCEDLLNQIKELTTSEHYMHKDKLDGKILGLSKLFNLESEIFTSNRRLFVIGGQTPDGATNHKVKYLNKDRSWEDLCNLPEGEGFDSTTACVCPDGIMLSGGKLKYNKAHNHCWIYVVATRRWKQMPSMAQGRYKHAAIFHRKDVYVIGGTDGSSRSMKVEKLSASEEGAVWTEVKPMSTPLDSHAVATDGSMIYVAGGQTASSASSRMLTAYNSNKLEWDKLADMPQPCINGGAAIIGGHMYVVSGSGTAPAAMKYDIRNDAWSLLTVCKQPYNLGAVVALHGEILLLGGWDNNGKPHGEVATFDPHVGCWRNPVFALFAPVKNHTAVCMTLEL